MTFRGRIRNGAIVLDQPVPFGEGVEVDVEITLRDTDQVVGTGGSLYEHYRDLIGCLDDMPEDWAENHDRYLREQHRS